MHRRSRKIIVNASILKAASHAHLPNGLDAGAARFYYLFQITK